jgi:GH18 family chitinase
MNREFPVESARGGTPNDYANFVTFLQNLRNALNNSGLPSRAGLSITLVSMKQYQHDLVD